MGAEVEVRVEVACEFNHNPRQSAAHMCYRCGQPLSGPAGPVSARLVDPEAVLRTLLEKRLRELGGRTNDAGEIIVKVFIDGKLQPAWSPVDDLLDRLAPASPEEKP